MRQTYLIFLVFLVFSCNTHDIGLYVIDPEKLKGDIITMSDIADDITYIPLDNKYPIGIIYNHKMTNGSVYLSAKDNGVLVFNNEGKEVRKIGTKGNGPGEYQFCFSFAVDQKTGKVYVLDREKIKVYSADGVFVSEITYGVYIGGGMADQIELFNSLISLSDGLRADYSENNWVFLDTLGNLVGAKKNSVVSEPTSFGGSNMYQFKDHLFYYNNFNDTVFSISNDLCYETKCLFDFGEHRPPLDRPDVKSTEEFLKIADNVCKVFYMFETNAFIVMEYFYPGESSYCFIEKGTKKSYKALQIVEKNGRKGARPWLTNDLDGGMPLTGSIRYNSNGNDEYITTLITASDLKTYVSGDEFKKSVPKNPEKKADIERLANSLSETDNPVLMMVRLKK